MAEPTPNIRHGQFHDVTGPAVKFNDVTFIPASIKLNGTMFDSVFELVDCVGDVPSTTLSLVGPGRDAPWVLGRLIRLFHVHPVSWEDRGEKSCLNEDFLAVLHNHGCIAVPFECRDYYGKTGLIFSSEDSPGDSLQAIIADAFWKLLFSNPTDIADYENKMYHSGAGVMFRFGVDDGEPFMEEEVAA